jgi:acetoin utilization protein AcuB
MKQMPMIEKYMTAMPHTISPSMPITSAVQLMQENHFRHLPVQDAGKLVGILTDRDIKLAASFQGAGELTVSDAMTPAPYRTTPQASLADVVFEMAEHKYGCAVVEQENGKIVGIFTATDGLRVLGEVLLSHFKAIQS